MKQAKERFSDLAKERLSQLQSALGEESIASIDRQHLEKVLCCSDYAYQIVSRRPQLLVELNASGHLEESYPAGHYQELIATAIQEANDEEALVRVVREQKRREMLRIAWRDICALASFEETVRDTSDYADAILSASLDWLHERHCIERGKPCAEDGTPQQLIVLALGKLGAQELNFSSDIDLIFCFEKTGQTQGTKRPLSNDEFFIRLARRFINVLSQSTEDGFVFRVDMRLRPFGAGGPLVTTVSAMEDYYQIHGRDWERYALIRARPVAGDLNAGNTLLEALRPFVYRRYLDFGALESLRDMKAMIRAEVARKSLQNNIKLGPGGIREIEFVGQAFQMVRGGRNADLRDRKILSVLDKLAEKSYLPEYSVRELSQAYIFLRTTEHRLQQVDDKQTHSLPENESHRLRLANGMGFETWSEFVSISDKHRARVQSHFDQVFGPSDDAQSEETGPLSHYWFGVTTDEEVVQALSECGFAQPHEALQLLEKLRQSYPLRTLSERGQQRLAKLMPPLLGNVAGRDDPLQTLQRVGSVIESIARRSVYLSLLIERPLALTQLVKLCAASPMITRQFARYPLILDELLDARSLYSPLPKPALTAELQARLSAIPDGDMEVEMDVLRQFKQTSTLRIAAADISNTLSVNQVSQHLTDLAEVCLQAVLDLSYRDMVSRYGRPRYQHNGQSHEAPFAIVAYGKFGGAELGFGSDLDLVFLHDSKGDCQQTDGEKAVENSVFFMRLAQRVIHMLSTRTADGMLYVSDTRLRPSGSDGLLVSSIDSFSSYQFEHAWVWEHQALVRARFVAGNPSLGERFGEIRQAVLRQYRDPEELKNEVRNMRQRMRTQLGTKEAHEFDLKQDDGGIADIEFVVQYAALRWSDRLGEHLKFTDTRRLMQGVASLGLLPAQDVETLLSAYESYRAEVHSLSLQEEDAISRPESFEVTRNEVRRIWSQLFD